MKKFLLVFACLLLVVGSAVAQSTRKVTGTVTSAVTGEALMGARVFVNGTSYGTITDAQGAFTLSNLPAKYKELTVSCFGMQTVKVAVAPVINVKLKENSKVLDEAMVVAYGSQKKSSFTGSAAVVKSEEIGKVQATNALDAVKGKAAGVQIYTGSGQPGSEPSVRIRGFNSLIAGQSPLLVVDGSPYDGSMTDINPADIESINVSKDAASTALYGARGGNGVIFITTKSAKKGKDATITLDAKWGSDSRGTATYDRIQDPRGYYEAYYQGLFNYAKNKNGYNDTKAWQWANENLFDRKSAFGLGYNVFSVPEGQYLIGANGKMNPNATPGRYVQGEKTEANPEGIYYILPENWEDEIYKPGLRQEYNLTASGANDRGSYYASVGYLNQEGITAGSDYERISARFKSDYQLKSWLKFGSNINYTHYDRNRLDGEGDATSGNIFALQNMAPIYPIYYRNGKGEILQHKASGIPAYDYGDGTVLPFTRAWLNQSNPLSDNRVNTENTEGNTVNGNFVIDANIMKGLTFTSINNLFIDEYRYTGVTNPWFGQYAVNNGIVTKQHGRNLSTNFQQRFNYHTQLGADQKHDLEVTAGHEYFKSTAYNLYYSMGNMFSMQNQELGGAVVPRKGSSSKSTYNTESWFARAMYSYDDRYFAQASIVSQGSSAFHPKHRWGVFYSGSLGWMINKEEWFKASWVDQLKAKLSYGENGNDFSLDGYYYTDRYTIANTNNEVSLTPSTRKSNENFSWEKNAKFNLGVDFAVLGERLWGSVEYYYNKTNDLISSVSFAPSYGYTNYYANVGNMRNSGIEIDLHGDIIRSKDFTWNAYANITSNSNRILKLAAEVKQTEVDGHFGYSSGNFFYTEGASRYTFYAYKYAGVYNENTWASTGDAAYDPTKAGMALYYHHDYELDANNQPVKDAEGRKVLKENGITTTYKPGTDDYYLCDNVLADIYGGLGTSFTFKGFDLAFDFQYQLGGKVFDSEYQNLMGYSAGYGMHKDILNAWSPENPNSDTPRIQYGDSYMASTSDRFLTSASYLSLSNITLGYTLPNSLTSKLGLQKVRVYAVADNIYTWSARKGLDPRQSITGSSNGRGHSTLRTISAGVSVTF